jgi:uncharacterized damage-inducible protein DinB
MSPRHRAETARDAPRPVADDAAAAGGAAEPDVLDLLVTRLAAEQAVAGDAAPPASGPGERPEPPLDAGELETLSGFLDFLRATIAWKVDGLTDDVAGARRLGSATTVTGMIRHLADTERYWFRKVLGAVPTEEVGYRWSDGHDTAREWAVPGGASLAEAVDDYRAATEQSRAQLVGRSPADQVRGGGMEARSVRWVLTHMIEETARHAGQLDILTELLDGRTGE